MELVADGPDGWLVLDGRFRVAAAKAGPAVVVTPGPEATGPDRVLAAEPRAFGSVDDATAWLADVT